MSRLVYADSGAFIALVYRRDAAHQRVSHHFRRLRSDGDLILTSDPVIAETVTRLRYDAGRSAALTFGRILDAATDAGQLIVRESDAQLRRAAFATLEQFPDLQLSYADAVGAAIARERRVDAVFGVDRHFRIMGLPLEPG